MLSRLGPVWFRSHIQYKASPGARRWCGGPPWFCTFEMQQVLRLHAHVFAWELPKGMAVGETAGSAGPPAGKPFPAQNSIVFNVLD